jgi:hypothetical protein
MRGAIAHIYIYIYIHIYQLSLQYEGDSDMRGQRTRLVLPQYEMQHVYCGCNTPIAATSIRLLRLLIYAYCGCNTPIAATNTRLFWLQHAYCSHNGRCNRRTAAMGAATRPLRLSRPPPPPPERKFEAPATVAIGEAATIAGITCPLRVLCTHCGYNMPIAMITSTAASAAAA